MRDHIDAADEVPQVDLQLDTLSGDIRDELLKRIRNRHVTWRGMTEEEQSDEIAALDLFSRQIVRRAVALVTKHEFSHAVVSLVEFKVKGGKDIEAKVTCPNIQHNRDALGDRTGQMCMLMMVDSEEFFGERDEAKPDPNQSAFDLEVAPEDNPETLALPKPSADLQSPDEDGGED